MVLSPLRKSLKENQGFSLFAVAMLIIVLGLFISVGAYMFDSWRQVMTVEETYQKTREIEDTLGRYLALNGRYPCAAPLDANPRGDAAETARYGVEVTNDCLNGGDVAGTFRVAGRDGNMVRIGAVPVRTLNLPDDYTVDGWGNRFVYAVTEAYASPNAPLDSNNGAIFIQDPQGNDVTELPGNVIFSLMSAGRDTNGAYSKNGNLLAACDVNAASAENCDYQDPTTANATFINTLNRSENENPASMFTQQFSYNSSILPRNCADAIGGPKDVGFIVDTSGSMNSSGRCPPELGTNCSRIDVARWAMRRVIPARIRQTRLSPEPGTTSMTGFVGYNTVENVANNLGDIVFDDPEVNTDFDPYAEEDVNGALEALEAELQAMCPGGITPLGIHIRAVADRLGDGDSASRPNVITIISDGVSNNGDSPADIIPDLLADYPNVEIKLIDVYNNQSFRTIADSSPRVSYFQTEDPEDLLETLYDTIGLCDDLEPTEPEDHRGCGSSGGWWNN